MSRKNISRCPLLTYIQGALRADDSRQTVRPVHRRPCEHRYKGAFRRISHPEKLCGCRYGRCSGDNTSLRTKAKSIVEMTHALYYDLNGVIPDTIEELTKLSGIGRKTANLIMGDVHHKPAIVADTHCIRITNRFGLTDSKDPKKVETDLKKLILPEKSSDFCHRLVLFGRDNCTQARLRALCAEGVYGRESA